MLLAMIIFFCDFCFKYIQKMRPHVHNHINVFCQVGQSKTKQKKMDRVNQKKNKENWIVFSTSLDNLIKAQTQVK